MRTARRTVAVAGAAVIAKAGGALGIGADLGVQADSIAGASCGTSPSAVLSSGMVDYYLGPNVGSVVLWYSSTCRSVAAAYNSDNNHGTCQPGVDLCGDGDVQNHSFGDVITCFSASGAHGCKTGYVDDNGITQRAYGEFDDGPYAATGWTGFY